MKLVSFLFLSMFTLVHPAKSQVDKAIDISSKLLKPGIVRVGLYYRDFPAEIKSLQEKAIANLNKSPEWQGRGIINMIKDGDRLVTYMDEMGLTKDEFYRMHAGFLKGKMRFLTDTGQIKIIVVNNTISFSGKEEFKILNHLSIDLTNKKIMFDCWLSTREYPRMQGILFSSGSEVHLERTKRSKKTKENLLGFTIGSSADDNKTIMLLKLTDDNIESSWYKPKDVWIVIL